MAFKEYIDATNEVLERCQVAFTRTEQMRCLESFRCNTNGAKYSRNVTSHVYTTRNVSGKNMTNPGELK